MLRNFGLGTLAWLAGLAGLAWLAWLAGLARGTRLLKLGEPAGGTPGNRTEHGKNTAPL